MSVYVADKLDVARHSLGGSTIAKAICKASSREIMGPKKKHVFYLLVCTDNEQVNIANLAELLFERSRMSSWVIVSKSLVTFHNLMSAGNERFLQHLGTRTTLWNLENFLDKGSVTEYDMSSFIRRYSNYLTRKVKSYVEMNYDFCRAKRGPDGPLKSLETPKLLKALVEIQILLDVLLEVDLQSSEFNNGVINSAFVLLFKDMIKLFACYNDGIINLLEKYYEMGKEDCKESLNVYKKFTSQIDSVKKFFNVAEDVGVKETATPDLVEAPRGLLKDLESHYQSLKEGKIPNTSTKNPSLLPVTDPTAGDQINFVETETQKTTEEDKETSPPKTVLETAEQAQPTPQDSLQTLLELNDVELKDGTSDNNNDLSELQAVFAAQQSPTASFPINSNFSSTSAFSAGGINPYDVFGPAQSNSWGQDFNHKDFDNLNNDISSNPFEKNTDDRLDFSTSNPTNFPGVLPPMNSSEPQGQPESETSKGDLDSTLSKVAKSLDNLELFPQTTAVNWTGTGHQWTVSKPKVKTGGANFHLNPVTGTTVPSTSLLSPDVANLPPTSPVSGMARQQPMVGPGSTQPPIFGVQSTLRGQQHIMRPEVNTFPQQNVRSPDPFANSGVGNQALF